MTEPCASVSVLPTPANWIAAVPPLIVPALKTEEPPPPAKIPVSPPVMLAPALLVTVAALLSARTP
jgi:hypothetical protein